MNLVTYQMQGRTPVVCVGQLTSCLAHTEVVFCRCTLLVCSSLLVVALSWQLQKRSLKMRWKGLEMDMLTRCRPRQVRQACAHDHLHQLYRV